MKRALLIALVCALVGAFFVIPGPARADMTYTTTFDGGDILAYNILAGTLSAVGHPGNGLDGGVTTTTSCSTSNSLTEVIVTLPANFVVTLVSLDTMASGGGAAGWSILLQDSGNSTLQTYTGSTSADGVWRVVGSGAVSVAGAAQIRYVSSVCDLIGRQKFLDNLVVEGHVGGMPTPSPTPTGTPPPNTVGWNSPLRTSEQLEPLHWGSSSYSNLNGVTDYAQDSNLAVAFSDAPTRNVYSVRAGTVSGVTAVTTCYGGVYTAFKDPGQCLFRWFGDDGNGWSYWNKDAPLYVITVDIESGYLLRYLVVQPQVNIGQSIQAGCLIGKTWAAKYIQMSVTFGFPPQVSIDTNAHDLQKGVALVQMVAPDGVTSIDGTQLWLAEPSATACAVAEHTSCQLVGNASLDEALGFWEEMPGHPEQLSIPWMPGGGVEALASVSQVLSLDSAASYTIAVGYVVNRESTSLPQHIDLTLGTTSIPVDFPNVGSGIKTIDAASYTADRSDGYYTFGFSGDGDFLRAGKTLITFLCVSDTAADPIEPGGGCMVRDPNFSLDSANTPWTLSSDPPAIIPPADGGGGGMAVVPDGASIYDQITLNPKDGGAEQDYKLAVTWRRQGVTQTDHNMSLAWQFDAQSGTLGPSTSQTWQTDYATISVSTDPITADLYLTGDGSHSTEAAQVSMVCIRPTEGGTAPGYSPAPVFDTTASCRACIYSPTGDLPTDFTEYVSWLNCQFWQLWECQLKILLRYIWQTLVNILTLFGFFRLWLGAIISGAVTWGNANLTNFAYWLQGQIHNAVQNVVWAILNWHGSSAGGGTNFWDVLIALINGIISLLTVFIQLVANLIQLIIQGVIGFLVNATGLLLGLLQSLINGLNAGATSIDTSWLPNCNDSNNGLFVVCTAIYGIEQGLAVGPFQYLVPVGIGLGALNLIWWGINRIRSVFSE